MPGTGERELATRWTDDAMSVAVLIKVLEFCSSFDAVQETCGVHCKCERESCWNQMGARAERDGSGRRDARGRTNVGRDTRLSSRVRARSQLTRDLGLDHSAHDLG